MYKTYIFTTVFLGIISTLFKMDEKIKRKSLLNF